jgi:hypothetical protein
VRDLQQAVNGVDEETGVTRAAISSVQQKHPYENSFPAALEEEHFDNLSL